MSAQIDFLKRCKELGLHNGKLSNWLDEIEALKAENEALKQQVEQGKRDAVPEGFTIVAIDMLNSFPEINPSNYDHDDACALNDWGVELVLAASPKEK